MHRLRFSLPPLLRRHSHQGSDDHTGNYYPDQTNHTDHANHTPQKSDDHTSIIYYPDQTCHTDKKPGYHTGIIIMIILIILIKDQMIIQVSFHTERDDLIIIIILIMILIFPYLHHNQRLALDLN